MLWYIMMILLNHQLYLRACFQSPLRFDPRPQWSLVFLIIGRCCILFLRLCLSPALSAIFFHVTFFSTIETYCSIWAFRPGVVITSTVPTPSLLIWIIISPVSKGSGDVMVLRQSRPPPVARRPPSAARNGVNAITQNPRDGLFSNLVYTLVVIVSWPD